MGDVKNHGVALASLPADSPARWFTWKAEKVDVMKPSDQPLPADMIGEWQWVWDPDANASYFSVWANQPTVNWARQEWQAEFKKVLEHWIALRKVDGFVFDYPDGYYSAGFDTRGNWNYTPDLIKAHITDQIHSIGSGRVAVFAELYVAPDREVAYGFDMSLGDNY